MNPSTAPLPFHGLRTFVEVGGAVSSQIKLTVWFDAAGILECVWLATAFSSGLARVDFS